MPNTYKYLVVLAAICAGMWGGAPSRAGGQAVAFSAPSYQPKDIVVDKSRGYVLPDGSVKIVGPEEMEGIITHWNEVFMQSHPGVHFTYVKGNSLAAIDSLIYDATAFAPSRLEYANSLTYSNIVHGDPFSIRVAHASLQHGAAFSPLAIIVNKANPMQKISMKQLAAIFSQGTRTRVFSRWSQAGVQGELAETEIRPCGLPWSDHYPSEDVTFGDFFFLKKLGANEPVRNYRMLPTYAAVAAEVASTPGAIGVTTLSRVTPDVKVLAVSRGETKPPSVGSADDIRDGSYPLDRYLRVYARIPSGKGMDPLVREYFRMVLSKEGQQVVADDPHGYPPLNPFELHEDLASFE